MSQFSKTSLKKTQLNHFKKPAHIHFIGICGTAMASLAGLLKKKGYKVTGSDKNFYPPMSLMLKKLKIPVFKNYPSKNLKPRPDFVIVGNVAQRKFPEIKALLKSDIPFTSLPRALYELILHRSQCIVITGTHGKTSTTALIAWTIQHMEIPFGFLIGGIPKDFPYSFQWPKKTKRSQKPWFVIEGDEYDTAFFDKVPKFNHYNAKYLVLTSLEFDHADIYKNLNSIKKKFISLLRSLPKDGWVVANADDQHVMDVIRKSGCKRFSTYGLKRGDYQIKKRKVGKEQEFLVFQSKKKLSKIKIKSMGIHNALNTLAAFVLTKKLNWNQRKVIQAFKSFSGVQNRQEILVQEGKKMILNQGETNLKTHRLKNLKTLKKEKKVSSYIPPFTLIKDFAHHPTSVKVTLEALREQFPKKRIIAVFEPRSYSSRKNIFQKKYIHSFHCADLALIAPPYRNPHTQNKDLLSPEKLVQDINHKHSLKSKKRTQKKAFFLKSSKLILKFLKKNHQKGDIIILMSNGPFDDLQTSILKELTSISFKNLKIKHQNKK